MARETKIGIALMALLLGVFGFVAYKKWDGLKSVAASKSDPTEAALQAKPAEADAVEPPGNPFAAAEPTSAPPVEQAEPVSDPFAQASAASSQIPVRPVSATTTDEWADALPAGQGEPVAQREPMAAAEQAHPSDPVEPIAGTESGSEFLANASTVTAVADADPFGDVAAATTSDSAPESVEPMPSDDPFAGEVAAVADATPTEDVGDPFAGAGDAAAAPAAPEADGAADPFAEASDASVASTDPTVMSEPATPSEPVSSEPADGSFAGESAGGGFAEKSPAAEFADATEPTDPAGPDEFSPAAEPADQTQETTDLVGIEPEPAEPFDAEPVIEDASAPAARPDSCVVVANDTYWSISQRVYGTPVFFQALAKYNEGRIQNPKQLRPGMTVMTPPASELTTRFPKLISGRGVAAGGDEAESFGRAGFLLDENRTPAYRVGDGDTLGKIAQAHLGRASRWVQIYNLNRELIPDAKSLKPGTVLRLPADASRVRLVPEG